MNRSKAQIRSEVLATPVECWRDGRLVVRCEECVREQAIPIAVFCHAGLGRKPLQAILSRLRCSNVGCGRSPAYVRLDGSQGRQPSLLLGSLLLIGHGAYT